MVDVKARFAFTHGSYVFKRDEIKSMPAELALMLERSGHVHVIGHAVLAKKKAVRSRA